MTEALIPAVDASHSTLRIGDLDMTASIDEIQCPRNPDHGMVPTRWLPTEEREMITKAGCGERIVRRYENRPAREVKMA